MQTCSNCSESFNEANQGLVVTNKARTVATVCGACLVDVRVGKIVVRRLAGGDYTYEQWLPTEAMSMEIT